MTNSGNAFRFILAGTLIGGALGIFLFSSRSKTLRQNIARKTEGLADQLTSRIEEGKTLLTELQKMTDAAKGKVTRAMAAK